jgi:hypothetical protein
MENNTGTIKSSGQEVDEKTQSILSGYSDAELLEALKCEREKFSKSNKTVMKLMIDELIRRKVYPESTPEGNPNDIYTMVSGWGAYWHVYQGTIECPHCKADLRDSRLGPPFLRQIGISDRSLDRVFAWQCPDCKKTWARD